MTAVFKPGDRVRVTEALLVRDVGKASAFIAGHSLCAWVAFDHLEPAPASSPDTPEAGAAGERDALAAELRRAAASESGSSGVLRDLCTRAAKALETALRERDEARQRETRAMMQANDFRADLGQVIADTATELGCEADNEAILVAIYDLKAALSSEQSAHAETRKALEEVEDALEHLRSIAHHI